MTIDELGAECPQWLREANTVRADVRISPSGLVIWRDGAWLDGAWHGGVWRGGERTNE